MSGHSKWASIRHKKAAVDAKRGKIFTRHAKLIEIAAREGGGGDISTNTRLATAVDAAKSENVPNANIDRAIKKGSGELKGEQMRAITYEAYGPGSVAVIIECLTNNRNRTLSSVKSTIEKKGGRWAESGSVMYLFDQKGVVVGRAPEGSSASDELELSLIDAGAEDIDWSDDVVSITTGAKDCASVRNLLKNAGFSIETAGLKYIAQQEVEISELSHAKKVMDFVDALEEDDDVGEVHTNANISDDIASEL